MPTNAATSVLSIEFLYLDLTTCDRCLRTEKNLHRTIALAGPLLTEMSIDLRLKNVLVSSETEARAHRLPSSPTIRINGADIASELLETDCASCGELCGCAGGIDCRIWRWKGANYTAAPVGMIIQAIMGAALNSAEKSPEEDTPKRAYETPENLRRFFAAQNKRSAASATQCCSTEELQSCCAPSAKAECCAPTSDPACGCR